MKVGIVCYPTHGGSGVVASELAIGLAKRGHEIHIVSYAPPFRLQSLPKNVFFHKVEISSYPLFEYPPYALTLAAKLVELTEAHHLEIIHAHYAVPHAASAYLAKQILDTRKIKIITTLHGTDITLVGADPSFYRVIKFTIEKSDGVTVVSHYLKQQTIQEFKIERPIKVIYNFIDPGRPERAGNPAGRNMYAPHGEKIIMHASNFRPLKRVGDVVRIFARVRTEIPSKLLLIGDGPERKSIQQLAEKLKISDDVFFLGEQDYLEPFYLCSDLYLLPSALESFGLSALEAMNCGVPVVGTNRGGLPEVVIQGKTGYLFPPANVDDMAEKTIELLTNPHILDPLRKQARLRAVRFFDADQIIPQYEEFYADILQT